MFRSSTVTTWCGSTFVAMLAVAAVTDVAVGQGTAIVRIESRLVQPNLRFGFVGAVEGSIAPGESIEASGLASGRFSASQPAPSPWLALVDIRCDDQQSAAPSTGIVAMRTANFHIEDGETVTCTFVYDGFEDFILPDDLPEGAGFVAFPRPGVWGVTNDPGSFKCDGVWSRDLKAVEYNRGEITVFDGGARIFTDSYEEDREDAMMFRVPGFPGRYTGWVADTYEGYHMIVHGVYQFVTDEWIVGYMFSDLTVEGISCRIFRPFQMHYEEPPPN